MAFPALAALIPMAKGLAGIGYAKGGAAAISGFAKGAAARAAIGGAAKKVGAGKVGKFAGDALSKYMGPGGVTAGNIAANFAPDAVFGVMQGAMTPGDLGDKIIAGGSTAIGGALGGVGAVSA